MAKKEPYKDWIVRYYGSHNDIPPGHTDGELTELIRCKDCKWGRESCGNIECHVDLNIPSEYHGYDWYCPNGERKEE